MAFTAISIGEIFNQWEQMGIFTLVLPFLLIFAVVYAILNKSKVLGENKGVQAVIAFSVGLLAIINPDVTNFFQVIFPRVGVGISVLLIAIILVGLIASAGTKWATTLTAVLFGLGGLIFLIIIFTTFADLNWFADRMQWSEAIPTLIAVGIIITFVVLIIKGGKSS
jgi:hypothetical protein